MVECGELDRRRGELSGLNRPPLLDTPETPLNQAFAWAVRRDPAGVRADPGVGLQDWGADEYGELIERGQRFRRVGPAALSDPKGLLRQVVAGLFGVRADAAGGRFEVAPWIPDRWRGFALRRLRCHRTLLAVEIRARTEWVTVRVELSFGPPIPISIRLRNRGPLSRVTVDEIPLEADHAVFTLQGQHEVVFFFRGEAE